MLDIFQEVVAQNHIERSSVEQTRQFSGVPMFERDLVAYAPFECRALRDIQHRQRGIEHRHMNTETRQANGGGSSAAPQIAAAQRVVALPDTPELLQLGKSHIP